MCFFFAFDMWVCEFVERAYININLIYIHADEHQRIFTVIEPFFLWFDKYIFCFRVIMMIFMSDLQTHALEKLRERPAISNALFDDDCDGRWLRFKREKKKSKS